MIQNDEQELMDPADQPISTVTKITAVCELVSVTTTKPVNNGLNMLETAGGSMKFAWKVEQI